MATAWKQIIESHSAYDPHGFRERRLNTGFCHLRVGFSAHPDKDDKWARWKATQIGGFESAKWRREFLIDYRAYSGQRIWPMLNEKLHNTQVDISEHTLFRVIDQGIRHPTVAIWVAVNAAGDRHIYREYYATNRSIAMNCRRILALTPEKEIITENFIDPSARRRSADTLIPMIETYNDNGLECTPADNSFSGYDKVSEAAFSTLARVALRTGVLPAYFGELQPSQDELLRLAEKPALTFDLRFTSRCFQECANLRWQDTKGDLTQKAEKEKPVDKDDDGPDTVRYAVMSELRHIVRPSSVIKFGNINTVFQARDKQRKHRELIRRNARRAYN